MSAAPASSAYVNYAPSTRGRVVAICECCGRRSKPMPPDKDGEPDLWSGPTWPRGWSTAPYPHDFRHPDGSTGATYTCPACNKRLAAGEALTLRNYETPGAGQELPARPEARVAADGGIQSASTPQYVPAPADTGLNAKGEHYDAAQQPAQPTGAPRGGA